MLFRITAYPRPWILPSRYQTRKRLDLSPKSSAE